MAYKKIKSYEYTEEALRDIWRQEYCTADIFTFDNVLVKIYEDMFDHIFFESSDRRNPTKDILSLNRLEKIYWIKETLQDPTAILKHGWDSKNKKPYKDRRVAIVKNNYIVIIRFTGKLKARLVTAYEKNDIENVLKNPDFEKESRFLGNI